MKAEHRAGWFVFCREGKASVAHYVAARGFRPTACRARLSFTNEPRWDVADDVGAVPLCERCKVVVRGLARPMTKEEIEYVRANAGRPVSILIVDPVLAMQLGRHRIPGR